MIFERLDCNQRGYAARGGSWGARLNRVRAVYRRSSTFESSGPVVKKIAVAGRVCPDPNVRKLAIRQQKLMAQPGQAIVSQTAVLATIYLAVYKPEPSSQRIDAGPCRTISVPLRCLGMRSATKRPSKKEAAAQLLCHLLRAYLGGSEAGSPRGRACERRMRSDLLKPGIGANDILCDTGKIQTALSGKNLFRGSPPAQTTEISRSFSIAASSARQSIRRGIAVACSLPSARS